MFWGFKNPPLRKHSDIILEGSHWGLFYLLNKTVSMSKAIVYEPAGSNETPLKYTAGLVLAVPVDCDLVNVRDISLVKVAIRTPDQKVRIVVSH